MAKKIEYSTLTAIRDELNAILGDAPAAAPAPAAETSGDSFDDMAYNDLKKLCKSKGLSPAGDRKALIARLSETDSEESEEEEEEETPAPKTKKSAKGKKSAPAEEEEEEEDESEEEDDADDVAAQVAAATEDMTTEELAEFCTDNGLSPKGKRESLLARIVKAVEAGDIELSSDDDEDEDEEEEEDEKPVKKSKGSEKSTSKSSKKSKKDEEEEEEEEESEEDEGEETEERKTALKAYDKDTRSQFKKGELDRGDIIEFLADFNDVDKKTYKKMSDGALIDAYIDASSMLINDEGEIVEEGAYTVNGVPYCCGHELSYDEDSGKYVCEHCGEEYEADED